MLWDHIHLKSPMESLKDKIKLEEFERTFGAFLCSLWRIAEGVVNPWVGPTQSFKFQIFTYYLFGWWFHFFCFRLYIFGEDFQFDYVFSDGLKPPTSYGVGGGATARVNCRVFVSTSLQRWNHGTNLAPAVVYEIFST